MSRAPLEDLVRITAAARRVEEARMQRLVEEETALRAELDDLDAARRANQALGETDLAASRSVGADMLWQGWVARSRRQLQIRLARVLARKGDALRDLRKAYGRGDAAQSLLDEAGKEEADARTKGRIEQEQSLMILRAGRADGP
ncbi:MAG: hypothetical protein RID23_11950 [Roseovarius sp.]